MVGCTKSLGLGFSGEGLVFNVECIVPFSLSFISPELYTLFTFLS